MSELVELITAQRDLQTRLGYDFLRMTDEEKIAYIRENVLACTDELHEALKETGWKSWAASRHINHDAYLGELRDAWQHLTNLMLVALPYPDMLAEWFEKALAAKHAVNDKRIGRYDGVSTKCPSCSRALEDVSIREVHHGPNDIRYYCVCDQALDRVVVERLLAD